MAKAITTWNLLTQLLLTSGGELSRVFSCVDVAVVNVVLDGVSIAGPLHWASVESPGRESQAASGQPSERGKRSGPCSFLF